jgi:DNA-binding NarL/FixJ family response regulator
VIGAGVAGRAATGLSFGAVEEQRLRVLLADDDAAVRAVLAATLGRGFDVVGEAVDAVEAIELARRLRPDAALVDLNMPQGGGRAAVPGIVAASPNTAIVVISSDEEDSIVRELLIAGAVAYVLKGTDPSDTLRRAIVAHRDKRFNM